GPGVPDMSFERPRRDASGVRPRWLLVGWALPTGSSDPTELPGGWGLVFETPVVRPPRRGLEDETPATHRNFRQNGCRAVPTLRRWRGRDIPYYRAGPCGR